MLVDQTTTIVKKVPKKAHRGLGLVLKYQFTTTSMGCPIMVSPVQPGRLHEKNIEKEQRHITTISPSHDPQLADVLSAAGRQARLPTKKIYRRGSVAQCDPFPWFDQSLKRERVRGYIHRRTRSAISEITSSQMSAPLRIVGVFVHHRTAPSSSPTKIRNQKRKRTCSRAPFKPHRQSISARLGGRRPC